MMAYSSLKSEIQLQIIRIFQKRIYSTEMSNFWKVHGWGVFIPNFLIKVALHGDADDILNHHILWKCQNWTSNTLNSLPLFLQTLRLQMKYKIYFHQQHSTFFLLSSRKRLPTLYLVQVWLDIRTEAIEAPFLKWSVCGSSWCCDTSLSLLLSKLSQVLTNQIFFLSRLQLPLWH